MQLLDLHLQRHCTRDLSRPQRARAADQAVVRWRYSGAGLSLASGFRVTGETSTFVHTASGASEQVTALPRVTPSGSSVQLEDSVTGKPGGKTVSFRCGPVRRRGVLRGQGVSGLSVQC